MIKIRFSWQYFLLVSLLLVLEIFIGSCMHDAVIRPYGGDFLVVILLYSLVKSLFNTAVLSIAAGVLIFAYATEVSQYFHLVTILGWEHLKIARMMLGTSFSFIDMLMYTLGIFLVIVMEKTIAKPKFN